MQEPQERHILLRLSWLWVLLAGIGAYLLLLRTLVVTQNPNFLPSLILFGSMVVPATVLTFATTGGRRRIRVNAGTVAFTAIAGGILGTVAAGTLEYDTLRALDMLPMIMVALIEETSKIVVPTAVFLINRRAMAWSSCSGGSLRPRIRHAGDDGLRLYCPAQWRPGSPRRHAAAARAACTSRTRRLDRTSNGGDWTNSRHRASRSRDLCRDRRVRSRCDLARGLGRQLQFDHSDRGRPAEFRRFDAHPGRCPAR